MKRKKRTVYSATDRKEAVCRVKSGESVTEVSKDIGIARKTLYSWINTYDEAANRNKSTSLESQYVSGKEHPKSASKDLRYKIFTLVVKHPGWSITKYAHALSLGRHGVYNFLKKHDLTTVDARLAFSNLYYGPGKLETDIKLSIVRGIERGDISVSEAAREHNVSRKTIYSWIKRYQSTDDLNPLYVSGTEHPRSFAKGDIDTILATVKRFPSHSIHELARLTDYSSHGIYNVLSRYDLTTKDKRRVYAQTTDSVQTTPAVGVLNRVKSVFEQFTPQKAPAPPPAITQLAKVFVSSAGISSLVFLTFGYWIRLIVTAPSLSFGIGIVFAGISLLMGTFFFLYSFKYYITLAIVLSYSQASDEFNDPNRGTLLQKIFGIAKEGNTTRQISSMAVGLESNLDHIHLTRHPYVSVQIPFFNEKYVAERAIIAATNFEYHGDYEVFVCDDSTDETTQIIHKYLNDNCIHGAKGVKIRKEDGWELRTAEVKPGVTLKHLHRTSRSGYKGAALKLALTLVDERTEFISIFDADFVPYPDSLELFLKYFKAQNNGKEVYTKSNVAAVQGYQWHVLNKSENWITRGVRSEYSGSYVIERSGQEVYGGLKHISGSVYMIRKDVLEEVGWASSITEDYELTLKLYEAGYKVVYTPYIQAPAECVSTLKRLIRQRMRWAEGHSYNVKVMWKRLLYGRWEESHNKDNTVTKKFVPSPLTFAEKVEFMFNIPYYLQAFFFLVGTLAWLLSEAIFPARFPFWTSLWGWSLVLTNMFALPLMNAVGLFLEESEERDYSGLPSFVLLSYLVVPFQAYAAMKGFLEKEEGGWFRTPKTGVITDVFKRGTFYRFVEGLLPSRSSVAQSVKSDFSVDMNQYLALSTGNNRFNNFSIKKSSFKNKLFGRLVIVGFVLLFIGVNYMSSFVESREVAVRPPTSHAIISEKTDFSLRESPEFTIVMPKSQKRSSNIFVSEVNAEEGLDLNTKVYYSGKVVDIPIEKEQTANGNYKITLGASDKLKPGKYTLTTSVGGVSATSLYSQDFTWGVLAVNFNKSTYQLYDEVQVGLGVVDDHGNTVCDADLEVSVKSNVDEKVYTTADNSIQYSGECGAITVTDQPDYSIRFLAETLGKYEVHIKALTENGERETIEHFVVSDSIQYDLQRMSATRIYPLADYEMKILVVPDEDFTGKVVEQIPFEFEVVGEFDEVLNVDGRKSIVWNVEWEAGKMYELSYIYDAPDVAPDFHLIGPLELQFENKTVFSESRQWQVAVDAVTHDATTDGGETTSFSHTVSGADRVLLVFVNMYQTSNPDVTSITYNGESLSKVTEVTNSWTVNRFTETQVWSLANPDTGTNTVSVSMSGSPVAYGIAATSYTGVDTADPIDATATNTGNSSNQTVDITTQNDDSIIVGGGLVVGGDSDPFSPGTGTTERWDNATGGNNNVDIGYFGGEESTTSSGTYTFDFNSSASDQWTIAAVEVVVPEKLLLFIFIVPFVPYYLKRRRK